MFHPDLGVGRAPFQLHWLIKSSDGFKVPEQLPLNEAVLGSSVLLLGAQDRMWKQQSPKVGLEGGFPVVLEAPLVPGTC